MKNCLHRTLFVLILFSLCFSKHGSFVDTNKEGIWEANELANLALAWEEESENEADEKGGIATDAFKLEKGGDGDGEDSLAKKHRFGKAPTPSFFAANHTSASTLYNLAAAKKSTATLANSRKLLLTPKPLLFLLFHNIKSDLAHPAA